MRLFDWLVEQINLSLSMEKDNLGHSISILDMFGFESSKVETMIDISIAYIAVQLCLTSTILSCYLELLFCSRKIVSNSSASTMLMSGSSSISLDISSNSSKRLASYIHTNLESCIRT